MKKLLCVYLVCLVAAVLGAENSARYFSVTVTGAVAKPGIVKLNDGCGLGDAISRAGAFTRFADRKQVVVRSKGEEKTYDLDLIFKGSVKGPALGEGDTVFVPERK